VKVGPVISMAAAIALAGCVAVWGGAYEVESADAQAVIIKYDGHFTSADKIRGVAQANCSRYGEDAIPQRESTSVWGLTTAGFACVTQQSRR
jgi:hypothetical protein